MGIRQIKVGTDEILIDIKTCDMTLSQVMRAVARFQAERPEDEIFMDGDLYAIVARPRCC